MIEGGGIEGGARYGKLLWVFAITLTCSKSLEFKQACGKVGQDSNRVRVK
jgi:hypothetical protein